MGSKQKPPRYRLEFAERLVAARRVAGLDEQQQVAEKLGLSKATYGRYERAETEPNIQTLAKIGEVLGVSLDFLVRGISTDRRSLDHPLPPELKRHLR